jgi:hypothetical protein
LEREMRVLFIFTARAGCIDAGISVISGVIPKDPYI